MIKCETCRAFYRFFRNEFDYCNNTGSRMLDSTYHMTLKLFVVKLSICCHLFRNIIMDVITLRYQICKPLVVYRFNCMTFYHFETQHHVIISIISQCKRCMPVQHKRKLFNSFSVCMGDNPLPKAFR